MNSLSFLAIAIVVSIVGSVIWVLRHRTPVSPYASIDKFTDRMSALDPSSPQGFSVIDKPLSENTDAAEESGAADKPAPEASEATPETQEKPSESDLGTTDLGGTDG